MILLRPVYYPFSDAIRENRRVIKNNSSDSEGRGFVAPPVAMNLFVAQTMTGINIVHITRKAWTFIIALLIMYVPQITLLPLRLLGIAY